MRVCDNSENRNCMSVKSDLPTITDSSMSPGQQFTPDEQCQQLYGPSSFYCAVSIFNIVIIIIIIIIIINNFARAKVIAW